MSKKSDDSIERIFRQALTQYDTTFKESDWLKMEHLLNEELKRRAAIRSKRIKGTAFTLTGLTGLIIAVYFLAFNDPSRSKMTLNDSVVEMQASDNLSKKGNVQTEIPSEDLLSPSAKDSDGKVNESDKQNSTRSDASEKAQETPRQNRAPQKEITKAQKILRDPLTGESTDKVAPAKGTDSLKPSTFADQQNTRQGAQVSPRQQNLVKDKTDDGKGILPQTAQNVDDQRKISRQDDSKQDDVLPSNADKSFATQDSAYLNNRISDPDAPNTESNKAAAVNTPSDTLNDNVVNSKLREGAILKEDSISREETVLNNKSDSLRTSEVMNEGKQKIKPSSRWSVGVVLAPEFSTTSLSSYSKPGESIGLRIGYQVSNRFNISTGVIRSMKKYIGSGDEYQPRNPAYWQIRTNGVVPEEIDSKCLVYELPLTVQFDVLQREKSRLFVSTAISSYLMKSQAYDYTFSYPNPGADMGWRSQGSESYWFSVGMISAGYERYIHRSLAIGIEPYLKISLSEIGWPNVKLFSTGAYVTLRYRFMIRNNNGID